MAHRSRLLVPSIVFALAAWACDQVAEHDLGSSDAGPSDDGGRGADDGGRGSDDAGAPRDGGALRVDGGRSDAGMADGGGHGSGASCGGFAGQRCPAGEFCDFSAAGGGAGCGVADGFGVCASEPQGCPDLYRPVCGCDLHSYPSPCDAHAAAQGVLHEGLCTSDECTSIGGQPAYSDGASTPSCPRGKQGYALPGREPALCCY